MSDGSETARRTVRARVAGLRVDVTPLRTSRDFRLLFWAGTVFYLGGMVSYVALPYQIYSLTGSNFAVGAMGLVELAPLIVFGLYGGALADHVDRRTMLVWTALAQVALTAALLGNAVAGPPERVDHLRHRLPAGDRAVAAATQPRGLDPAHGAPRRAARGRGGLVARHADRHPARAGDRWPAGRTVGVPGPTPSTSPAW